MIDGTKRQKDDLRFLLKDKYYLSEIQTEEIIHGRGENLMSEELRKDVDLLNSGYPLDYIIGYTDFLGLKIYLNHHPLIPRPETEFWTQKIINSINRDSLLKILDVFCGSGCIGLALLKSFPNTSCTFSDINPDYLSQTKQNADINSIDQERIGLIESDVFERISEKYDLIVANPPYVSKHEPVDESIRHEPEGAIFAHNNGFELIDRFLKDAQNFLNPKGRIFIEIGENQKDGVNNLLQKYRYANWNFNKDQFDKWRWVEIY